MLLRLEPHLVASWLRVSPDCTMYCVPVHAPVGEPSGADAAGEADVGEGGLGAGEKGSEVGERGVSSCGVARDDTGTGTPLLVSKEVQFEPLHVLVCSVSPAHR